MFFATLRTGDGRCMCVYIYSSKIFHLRWNGHGRSRSGTIDVVGGSCKLTGVWFLRTRAARQLDTVLNGCNSIVLKRSRPLFGMG